MILVHDEDHIFPSLEFVNHQSPDKYKAIQEEMDRLYEKSSIKKSDFNILTDLIYQTFGIQYDIFHMDDQVNASAELLVLNDRSTMFTFSDMESYHLYMEEHAGDGLTYKQVFKPGQTAGMGGKVDYANAKVSGEFSTYVMRLYLGIIPFRQAGLTSREIVAVLFHEIGHTFSSFAYSAHMASFNQVLESCRERKLKSFEEIKTFMIEEGKRKNVWTQDDINALAASKTHLALGYHVANSLVEKTHVQDMTRKYDDITGEQVADMFSARLGYGVELISGLKKFVEPGADKYYTNTIYATMAIIFQVVVTYVAFALFLLGSGAAAGFIMLIAPWTIGGALAMALFMRILIGGVGNTNHSYDTIKRRLIRIRQQLIDRVKTADTYTSRAQLNALKAQLKDIDALIKVSGDTHASIYDGFMNTFSSRAKQAKFSIKFEQTLEDLLYSDLHVGRATLSTLIK